MYLASCWLALSSTHARRVCASAMKLIVWLSAWYWPPNELQPPWPLAWPCSSNASVSEVPATTGNSAPTAPKDTNCHCVPAIASAAGGRSVGAGWVPCDASTCGEQAAASSSASPTKVIRILRLDFISRTLPNLAYLEPNWGSAYLLFTPKWTHLF